ncbi:response regulator transcription factor [Aliiroseovarius sp. PTFE2010]|uniref:response regulator transcription factor n=1 Tax=Aliiroseovarius sp. PTFE2010 TaxID=3417190 RepID=UPI003CEEF36D
MRILLAETSWHSATAAADLRKSGFLVTAVNDGSELMEFATDSAQSAIILEMNLPDMDGFDLVSKLRAADSKMPIFVLAEEGDWDFSKRLFELGADDVLVGKFSPAELAERVRAAVRRSGGYGTVTLQVGDLAVNTRDQSATFAGQPIKLTRKEYEIVEMLALNRDRMVSRDEIMAQLYAWEDEPAARILNVYLSRIRSQIAGAGGVPEVLQTVWGLGYRLHSSAEAASRTQAA